MPKIRKLMAACLATLLGMSAARGQMFDVYRTRQQVSVTPAAPMLKNASCTAEVTDRPLELEDAILQAVCASPQAREAWANARTQAAAVGIGESAYLPTLTATGSYGRENSRISYDYPDLGRSIAASQNSSSLRGALNLSWVLFDFGKRGAALRQARQLLAAANAAHDDVLQTVFFYAAQAYYTVRDAQAAADSAQQSERIAKESLAEASAKHDAGAGTLGDQMQAQTSYRRAILDRVAADGEVRTAVGTLAVAMGLDANTPVHIAVSDPTPESAAFTQGVNDLIEEAKAQQPKLVAARAKLEAARANVDAVRAQGLPTISLTGSLSQSDLSHQQPQIGNPGSRRDSVIGIQVTIPLFEGFASGYRTAQAQAQADAQEAELQNTELQVSLDVWKNYQSLEAATANLGNSKELLADAQRSLEIARGRYKAGVGTFTELLTAQTALIDAQRQRVLAVSKWRTARLGLGASLGQLGLWREHQ